MMMMRKHDKKYKDVMIKHIRMNGLCCEVFEKGMALSHLPIMMKITKQDRHGKKEEIFFLADWGLWVSGHSCEW